MMILRRYGTKVLSVTPNFDSRAMTEVGFVRDGAFSMEAAEFDEGWERSAGRELAAQAKGNVQGDVEDAVLASLREQLDALAAGLEDGHALLIENSQGVDQPKTRGTQKTILVEGENRLVFEYSIDPPLRLGVMRPK
jgi:hypothetical protein